MGTLKLGAAAASLLRAGQGVLQRAVNLTEHRKSFYRVFPICPSYRKKSIVPSVSSERAAFVRGHHLVGVASLL